LTLRQSDLSDLGHFFHGKKVDLPWKNVSFSWMVKSVEHFNKNSWLMILGDYKGYTAQHIEDHHFFDLS